MSASCNLTSSFGVKTQMWLVPSSGFKINNQNGLFFMCKLSRKNPYQGQIEVCVAYSIPKKLPKHPNNYPKKKKRPTATFSS